MARIYIARTTGIGSFERHVVLKLITPERANDTTAVQMFLDEARLAASLNHQNVAQVFEVGEDAGIHYLAMEYVHGQDLRALLAKAGSQGTRVPLELALTVVAGAAAGLNHAHERRDGNGVPLGIVHRDVSPSNIMIGLDGSVKLLDFGIAKATARSIETVSGIIKGKFAYMSPEQCRGRDVDRRSDVFSLGIILYEISTQHRCFRADSDFDTMHRIVTGDVVRPTRLVQNYPPALEAIVMKALAIDANQRYQSAGLLLEAIEAFAVSARMSLSTMALGRFMREMFGETPEPWLAAGRGSGQSLPLQPKEATISNTNASSEAPRPVPTAPPAAQQVAARTLLDLPPNHDGHDEDEHVEWNAKSYPTGQPSYASMQTLPPDNSLKATRPLASIPPAPAPPPAPRTLPVGSQSMIPPSTSPSLPGLPPVASAASSSATIATSVPPPPAQFGAQPGSGSGPSHEALSFGSARASYPTIAGASATGLANVSEISYPRYEPPPEDSLETPQLKPNRKPLIIGVVLLVLVGIAIVLVIGLNGRSVESPDTIKNNTLDPPTPPPSEPTNNTVDPPTQPTQTETPDAATAVIHVDAGAAEPPPEVEESISLKVVSDPPQANVLLNGKPIGTTPLDTKIPRGTGAATLVVQRAGYEEVLTKIDLTGDFSKEVTLVKKADKNAKPEVKKPPVVEKKPPGVDKKPPVVDKKPPVVDKKPPTPPKPACQPPNQVDPFDTRPVCKT